MELKSEQLGLELNVLLGSIHIALGNTALSNENISWWESMFVQCDQALLIQLASHHRMVSWLDLALSLNRGYETDIESEFFHRLRNLAKILRFNSVYQTDLASTVCNALEENGITNVVFKGPALIRQLAALKHPARDHGDML